MESFQDSIFVSVLLVPSCPLWFSTNQISTIKYILIWAHKQIIWLRQQIQKFQDSICVSCTICQHHILSALDEWNINYQKLSKTITSANNLSRQQTQKFQDLICVSCAICQHCILSALDEWYNNFHFASTLCIVYKLIRKLAGTIYKSW